MLGSCRRNCRKRSRSTVAVARTLADLEGTESVRRLHVAEALSYRRVVPGRG